MVECRKRDNCSETGQFLHCPGVSVYGNAILAGRVIRLFSPVSLRFEEYRQDREFLRTNSARHGRAKGRRTLHPAPLLPAGEWKRAGTEAERLAFRAVGEDRDKLSRYTPGWRWIG